MATETTLSLSDGSSIHVGDARAVTGTVTDADDVAATPTQFKMAFTPASGTTNQTVYAKTISGAEVAFTSQTSNTFTANHVFDEAGVWEIVAAASGNMNEVEPKKVVVLPVSNAPS